MPIERAEGFWWVRETQGSNGTTAHGEDPDGLTDWVVGEVSGGRLFWPGSIDDHESKTLEWGPYLGKAPESAVEEA